MASCCLEWDGMGRGACCSRAGWLAGTAGSCGYVLFSDVGGYGSFVFNTAVIL